MWRSEFRPDDPNAPPAPVFDAPWQAQAMAMADALVKAGHISAVDWGEMLGAALRRAEAEGAPDTVETYYLAVLGTLEQVSERQMGVSDEDRQARRAAWEEAYDRTPHGEPVVLDKVEPQS